MGEETLFDLICPEDTRKKREKKVTPCRSCGDPIYFVRTKFGKDMPVNDEELSTIITDNGNVIKGRRPHFITCPNAHLFRRSKKETMEPKEVK